MDFIKNIFGKKNEDAPQQKPVPGDYFYTVSEKGYTAFRLLADDLQTGTYHLTVYKATPQAPQHISELTSVVLHAPVDSASFTGAVVFAHQPLQPGDFEGYHEYLRQTNFSAYVQETHQNMDALIEEGRRFYREGYYLSDEGRHEDAIAAYTKALDILPPYVLYEAWDNRALSKMDLGRFEEAANDLQYSLKINGENYIAAFALGECYLQLDLPDAAREMYAYTLSLHPTHAKSIARMKMLS